MHILCTLAAVFLPCLAMAGEVIDEIPEQNM